MTCSRKGGEGAAIVLSIKADTAAWGTHRKREKREEGKEVCQVYNIECTPIGT